jgi:hypothetical protein
MKHRKQKGGTFIGDESKKPNDYDHTDLNKFKEQCHPDIEPISMIPWDEIAEENRISFFDNRNLYCFDNEQLLQSVISRREQQRLAKQAPTPPINPFTTNKLSDNVINYLNELEASMALKNLAHLIGQERTTELIQQYANTRELVPEFATPDGGRKKSRNRTILYAGRKYIIRIGSKGGQYILRNKKKIYI